MDSQKKMQLFRTRNIELFLVLFNVWLTVYFLSGAIFNTWQFKPKVVFISWGNFNNLPIHTVNI